MAEPAIILEGDIRIPADVHDLVSFRRWATSDEFPEHGRIDFLAGDVEVEMSPEDLYTHGTLKAEIAGGLQEWIARSGRGLVFVDRARVSVPAAGLSVEPDVVVVLRESLESGKLREVPRSGHDDRYIELEGPPDLVVEVVSDGSVAKDTRRLPALYARAGVGELWRLDARSKELSFEILTLAGASYGRPAEEGDGWLDSPLLGHRVRLTRLTDWGPRWRYRLEKR